MTNFGVKTNSVDPDQEQSNLGPQFDRHFKWTSRRYRRRYLVAIRAKELILTLQAFTKMRTYHPKQVDCLSSVLWY